MALRVCLVTPFSWSQPHDVNEHVAGLAAGLRKLGHSVTVLAPSGRAADLLAGRRALAKGREAEVIAVGPAVPISRRSRMGVPVGIRANLALALAQGRFEVVHGFEPRVSGHVRVRPSAPGVKQEPPLPVTVELADGAPPDAALADEIRGRLRQVLVVQTEVELVPFGSLQRSEYKSKLVEHQSEGAS